MINWCTDSILLSLHPMTFKWLKWTRWIFSINSLALGPHSTDVFSEGKSERVNRYSSLTFSTTCSDWRLWFPGRKTNVTFELRAIFLVWLKNWAIVKQGCWGHRSSGEGVIYCNNVLPDVKLKHPTNKQNNRKKNLWGILTMIIATFVKQVS